MNQLKAQPEDAAAMRTLALNTGMLFVSEAAHVQKPEEGCLSSARC